MSVLDSFQLNGAAAFVSGASRGLGNASALALAEAGADIALGATNESALEETAEAIRAMTEPPIDTRAFFRGRCLQRFPDAVVAANWDSLVFDVGTDALRRVPMMEPLRGTEAHVGTLFDECDSATELLRRLGN